MARFAQILAFSGDATVRVAALANATASTAQFIGARRIVVINATQDITIAFGQSTMAAPTAANYRIIFGQQTTFDMGPNSYIRVFNLGTQNGTASAGPTDVYIQALEGR